jgi:hypothetical protein
MEYHQSEHTLLKGGERRGHSPLDLREKLKNPRARQKKMKIRG